MHKTRDKRIPGEGVYFLKPHKVLLKGICCSNKPYGVGKRLRELLLESFKLIKESDLGNWNKTKIHTNRVIV